jgi:uncharacterized OB-fold protein
MTVFRVERDADSDAFFDGTGEGTLLIRRCETCGTYDAPASRQCRLGHELGWVAASGRARLVSWGVDHSPPLDPILAIPDGSASAFGFVELAEGPWIQVPLVGVEPASLREGVDMTVTFVRPGDGEAIPAFTLA